MYIETIAPFDVLIIDFSEILVGYEPKIFKIAFIKTYHKAVAITNPTPMQSTKTTHMKNAMKPPNDRLSTSAKRMLLSAREAARSTKKAGSSRAH